MSTDTDFGVTREQLRRGRALTVLRGLIAQDEAQRTGRLRTDILREKHAGAFGVDAYFTKDAAPMSGWTSTPTGLTPSFVAEIDGSVLARLGAPRVPALLPVPTSTGGATFAWVPEALGAPVGQIILDPSITPTPTKVVGIVVVPRSFVQHGAPGTLDYLLTLIRNQYSAFLDEQLVDPAVTAVANERPGALTENATPIMSAGSSVADQTEDARRLLARFAGNGGRLEHAVVLMSSATAAALQLSGHRAFDLTATGGRYMGIEALASEGIGSRIVMVDRSRLVVSDDGPADIELSTTADLELLDSSLVQSGATGTGTTLVSLWQTQMIGIKITRHLHWTLTDAAGCQYVDGVQYVPAGSPA